MPPLSTFYHPLGLLLFAGWWIATLYCVAICQKHRNIPVAYRRWYNLLVLLTGPWGLAVLLSRFRYPAHDAAVHEYRDRVEGGPVVRWFRRTLGLQADQSASETVVELCTADGKPLSHLDQRFDKRDRSEDSKALLHVKNTLFDAVEARATDVLVDPRSDDLYSIRFRIDGMLEEVEKISSQLALNMVNCLKIAARLDIAERRRPQDGSLMIRLPQLPINCRLATAGTVRGPKAAVRILDRRVGLKPVTSLGLSKADLQRLLSAASRKSGMILVCGPTGGGKTTTLYALLHQLDAQARNVVTVEDPIEYPLESATQTEVNEKLGVGFANVLRSILRQNPDVIFVGEVRDNETAELALQASNTGHLVLSTVHGNDSAAAILRLRDLGIPPERLAGAVTAVLSQRLVRKLCPDCKTPGQLGPEDQELAETHGAAMEVVYRPAGCPACRDTGFVGREGIFELLFVNREVNEVLAANPSMAELRDAAIQAGMVPMLEHGLHKVAAGETTFEEVLRVCQTE